MSSPAYYKANREKVLATNKKYRDQNREVILAQKREYAELNKARVRDYYLKHTFGITAIQYDALFEQQGGVCVMCGRPPNGRRLAVDHDHTTGAVRGLLCKNCNRGIGLLNDDPKLFDKVAVYLRSHGRV